MLIEMYNNFETKNVTKKKKKDETAILNKVAYLSVASNMQDLTGF